MFHLKKYGLEEWCTILRTTASDAVTSIPDGIGLLHIDGNHGQEAVLKDIQNYLPKVAKDGLVWFDDIQWESVLPAVEYAKTQCDLFEEFDANNIILKKKS